MESVWGDQIVEDANLTVTMSHLRKALGEKAHEHRFIVTARSFITHGNTIKRSTNIETRWRWTRIPVLRIGHWAGNSLPKVNTAKRLRRSKKQFRSRVTVLTSLRNLPASRLRKVIS
jgi:hypothetical protein